MVKVEEQVGLHELGLNEQDVPEGKLEQENETDCGLPEVKVAVTVVATLPPGVVFPAEGLTETEKSKGPGQGFWDQ
jgi:hypothetical protein